jgi:hypothetical protein
MKIAALLVLVGVTLSASAQIGSKIQQQSKIAGVWHNNQFGYQMTLMLNPDGRGEFDGDAIRYTAKDGKLSLTIVAQNQTTVYGYVLNANALTVSGGDLEQPVTFTKAGTTTTIATSSAPATISAIATPASTAPAATTLAAPMGSAPAGATTVATVQQTAAVPQSPPTPEQALIGTWTGNNESMEFRPDGKCIYNGTAIDYQVSRNNLILNTQQGTEVMAYTVTGNQLRMTINGAQYTYTKVEPSRQGSGGKQGARSATAKRSVPQELVGKWCWINVSSNNSSASSTCIVLNGDGTYLYNSETSRSVNTDAVSGGSVSQTGDQGTWWIEADRIYYNSPTQGQGSYFLEKKNHPKNVNDPMIVLDGQPYVTATVRQPWR